MSGAFGRQQTLCNIISCTCSTVTYVTVKLARLFYAGVDYALKKLVCSGRRFDKLRLFKHSLILCEKISKLQFLWGGQEFQNMMIIVDLAVSLYMQTNLINRYLVLQMS